MAATGSFFQEVELAEQKSYGNGIPFPVVLSQSSSTMNPKLTPKENLEAFVEAVRVEKAWLESLVRERNVILFRGFPVITPCDFNHVVEAFDYPEASYLGGVASRTKVVGRVYTANEGTPDTKIPFHHEMAYITSFPSKVFFFCEEEPGSGGATPIVLSHIIYDKMKERHPEYVAQLEEHGWTNIVIASDEDHPSLVDGRSWKSVYNTDDKKVAEERAAKVGTKLEWMENDTVKRITGPLPAIRLDKESQRKTWFNSLTGPMNFDKDAIRFEVGNGDPVPNDAMEDCSRILEEECVTIPWKKGDVMLINNLTVLHSRQPLLKPPRRILASLCK